MRKYLDKILPWRIKIRALDARVHLLEIELAVRERELVRAAQTVTEMQKQFDNNKKGVGVLLKILYRTQRINVPFSEGSIREALNRGQQNEK